MRLLVFRHGIAEDTAADGTDASRVLTAEGVRRTRKAGCACLDVTLRPDGDAAEAILLWLATAKMLRAAAPR